MTFFTSCCDLFTDTFEACCGVDVLALFFGYIFIRVGLGTFLGLYHATKRG